MILDWFDFRTFLLLVLVFVPLEHLLPIHDGRKLLRRGWLTDTIHFFLSGIFIRFGLAAVVWASTEAGSMAVPGSLRAWVSDLPLWVQVLAATVIADLGFYLSHRLMHAVPWLWNFHAVHHSSEQLDWLAAYRVHPVDQVIVKGSSFIPIFILGFSDASIAVSAIIYHWQALLIHSNVKIHFGPLKWILATPQFHHWHHANHVEAYDKNFAGQIALWDVLFGTAFMPDRKMPERYGADDPVPDTYPSQLMYPFARLFRGRRAPVAATGADTTERRAEPQRAAG